MLRWAAVAAVILAVILIPFALIGSRVDQEVVAFFAEASRSKTSMSLAVIALLGLDVIGPIPSSFVSTGAGALLGFVGGTLASTTGMALGCALAYWLGTTLGDHAIERFVGEKEFARYTALHSRFGAAALVLTRGVPVLAEAAVILGGVARMSFGRFMLVTGLANLGISAIYATTGALAMSWNSFLFALAGAILLPGAALLVIGRGAVDGGLRGQTP